MTSRLKIFQFAHSPFCIAVIQPLRAAGIEPELMHISVADRSEIVRLTGGAYYQVPVLTDGEQIVYESGPDSQDIATYLDRHYLGGCLFPAHTRGLQAIVNHYLENDVESVTFKVCDAVLIPTMPDVIERTLTIRHKERKFGTGCVQRWARERENLMAEAIRLLRPFEETLAHGGQFLFGGTPVYSDFLLFGILRNFTFCGGDQLLTGLPAVEAWQTRLTQFQYEGE